VSIEAVDSLCSELLTRGRSIATRAKYATAWRHFERFAAVVGLPSPWLAPCRRDDLHIRQQHGRALARFAAFLALGTATAGTVKKYVGHVRALHHERFGVE
jgi:hypothetical protein